MVDSIDFGRSWPLSLGGMGVLVPPKCLSIANNGPLYKTIYTNGLSIVNNGPERKTILIMVLDP